MKHKFCWFAPLLFLVAGCKDQPEPIPAYLHIEPFAVNAEGGANWQKITEGWVYINNELLGGYTLPATIPVLAEGDTKVLVYPGVKENGQTATPSVYPFMVRYETTINLTAAMTTAISPVTQYAANVIFPWSIERTTFDNSSIVLEDRDVDSVTTFELTTDGAFAGRSVKMVVDTAHALMEIATEAVSGLPATNAQPVWLEMNYKNDVPFELWILGSQSNSGEQARPVYQFTDSQNWNKIYFNLTDYLISLQQDQYRLYFRVGLPQDATGKFVQNNGTVLFDNLRLLHF